MPEVDPDHLSPEQPEVQPIESGALTRRLMLNGAAGGMVLVLASTVEPSLWWASPALVVFYFLQGLKLSHRWALSEALEKMKPIDRAEDDTLFPEEIDPYLARPSAWMTAQLFVAQVATAVGMLIAFKAIVRLAGVLGQGEL